MASASNSCNTCGKRIPTGIDRCLACSLNLKSRCSGEVDCKCLVCGARVKPRDEICRTCGTRFLEEIEVEADNDHMCMICGAGVHEKARYCKVCGTIFPDGDRNYKGPIVKNLNGKRSVNAS